MRVVFLSGTRFGLRCLEAARTVPECTVAGVVTIPQTFTISYRPQGVSNVLYANIPNYCQSAGIPCELLADSMNDMCLLEVVRTWAPDAIVLAGWYHLVPKAWRTLAPAYGLHASLLPDYSGGAPLVWALINGETRTGITLFQLDGGVDSGPIVGQAVTDISEDDTIATLYGRIEDLGVVLLARHLPALAAGTAVLTPQDPARRRVVPQRGPEDGRIDWTRNARDLYNFVRAQTRPYPGAFAEWDSLRVTIWAARALSLQPSAARPGEVLDIQATTVVATGAGALEVVDAEVDGQTLSGRELRWLLAARLPRLARVSSHVAGSVE